MGNSRFYSALAALLFSAVCAYTAAALFEAPEKAQALPGIKEAGAVLWRQEISLLGDGCFYAAFLPEGTASVPESCRIIFENSEDRLSAEIVFSSRHTAFLRITSDDHNLPRGLSRAELIY